MRKKITAIFGNIKRRIDITELRKFLSQGGYVLNKNNELIALAITENKNINNVEFDDDFGKLQYLNLSDNPNLKSIIFNVELPELYHLDISFNDLKTLQLPKSGLPQLNYFDASHNKLKSIDFGGKSPELKLINISNNPIDNIEGLSSLFDENNKFSIYLSPSDTLKKNSIKVNEKEDAWNILKNYFQSIKKEEVFIDLPVKVLMLGNHASGKTHLAQLLKGGYNTKVIKNINSTPLMETYEYDEGKGEFPKAIIYDFGGQDFYHGLYRMFMDSSCIYCFVWRNDKNIKEFSYEEETVRGRERKQIINHPHRFWLNQINYIENKYQEQQEEYSNKERTIIIQSHIDIEKRHFLELKDSDIQKFHIIESIGLMLDPKVQNDIDTYGFRFDFYKLLLDNKINNFKEKAPSSVLELINYLSGHGSNYFVYQETLSRRIENDTKLKTYKSVKRDISTDLLLLKKSGFILYYPENKRLQDKIWHKPKTVIKKFHDVFLTKYLNIGKISKENFDKLKLSQDLKQLYIEMNLLIEHKPDPNIDEVEEYIIPNYLPLYSENDQLFELVEYGKGELVLNIRFEHFIPFGMMSKISAFLGKTPEKKIFWRNAIFFTHNKEYKGLIRLDLLKNLFSFYIIHRDNKSVCNNEMNILKDFFFSLIINAYYDSDLDGMSYGLSENNEEDSNKGKGNPKIRLDIQKIPKDMYIGLNDNEFVSLKELNTEDKVIGKYSILSYNFEDKIDDYSNVDSKNDKPILPKLNRTKRKTGKEVYLRDYQRFSHYPVNQTIKIVISYARKDKEELDKLLEHLRPMERSKKIEIFYDKNLTPGRKFQKELIEKFEDADIIVSMITPKWANSDFILEHELPIALRRSDEDGFRHIPILIKPTNYKEVDILNDDFEIDKLKKYNLVREEDIIPASKFTHSEEESYLFYTNKIIEQINELTN